MMASTSILAEAPFPYWAPNCDGTGKFLQNHQLIFESKCAKVVRLFIATQTAIFTRFPKAHLLFDFVSKSFVQKTQKGLQMTSRYKLPPMAWGIGHDQIEKVLRSWVPEIKSIRINHYDIFRRGLPHLIVDRFLRRIPSIGNQLPGMMYMKNEDD